MPLCAERRIYRGAATRAYRYRYRHRYRDTYRMAKGLRSKSLRKAKAVRRATIHAPVEARRLDRVVKRDMARQKLGTASYDPDRLMDVEVAISLAAAKALIIQERIAHYSEFMAAAVAHPEVQMQDLVREKLQLSLEDAEQAAKLEGASYVAQDAVEAARAVLQSYIKEQDIDRDHNAQTMQDEAKSDKPAPTFSFKKALDNIKSKSELMAELSQLRTRITRLEKLRVVLKERKEAKM